MALLLLWVLAKRWSDFYYC